MGKPPRNDDPSERPGSSGAPTSDPDRAAILARRQRFIALALTGLATTACDKPNDDPTAPRDGKVVHEGKGDDGARDDGAEPNATSGRPVPCLEVAMPPPEDDDLASPQACLKVAAPPEEPPATPKPCLKVKPPEPEPEPEPRPHACLRVKPPESKPKPQPCLKVAKPRE